MRKQVHMIAVEERVNWGNGMDVHTLCGKDIENALPVLDFDIRDGHLTSVRTIHLCSICLVLALSPCSGKRYIYGCLPREQALLLNRESEEN